MSVRLSYTKSPNGKNWSPRPQLTGINTDQILEGDKNGPTLYSDVHSPYFRSVLLRGLVSFPFVPCSMFLIGEISARETEFRKFQKTGFRFISFPNGLYSKTRCSNYLSQKKLDKFRRWKSYCTISILATPFSFRILNR